MLNNSVAKAMDKNFLSSLLALETSSILSLFVFFSLIHPRFYYSKKIIIVCFFITLFWFILTIITLKNIKEKNISVIKYLISGFLYLLVIFYLVRTAWFRSFLTLAPEYVFFTGHSHVDSFYFAGLCEAIKNYGYPAVLSLGLSYHKYHYLSIALFAGISKILNIPCLMTYNYLYPVIFFPLFIYLFFQTVGVIRRYLNISGAIYVFDVVFSLFIIIGFLPFQYLYSIGIWWHDIFLSESFCVSIVLLLLYVVIIDKFKNNKNFENILYFLITPLFLFIISATKVSAGIILFIVIAWILIRRKGINTSIMFPLVLNILILFSSFVLFNRTEQNIDESTIFWFHYIKTYVPMEYRASHFIFILLPSILFFLLSKGKQPYNCFYKTKDGILSEAAIISTICSILPGILFEIEGGSAVYFFVQAMFISLLFLLSSKKINNLFEVIKREWKILLAISIIIIYGESFFNYSYYHGSSLIRVTPRYMIEQYQINKEGNKTLRDDSFYKTLNKINRITEGKKNNYCLYVLNDCKINKLYKGNYYWLGTGGLLAVTAYLGIPAITIPEKDQPATIESIKEKAKEMHIENIIVLEKDKYKIIY